MRIVLGARAAAATLEDPDDFTAFSVSAPAAAADELDARLGPLGDRDGEHVWVDRPALVALAGDRATDPGWQDGLAAMVDYARAEGFLSEDGAAIRAHIEWVR